MEGLSTALWALWGLFIVQSVVGGYLEIEMETVTQCGSSRIMWTGDDGPYHLLLTPTAHVQHGYNVWIPAISNGTNEYDLLIKQPAGMQFVVTMWGASGISYAATTDVMTVQEPANANVSCFLSDDDIFSLYTFSFNASDTYGAFPPQCSNMTISWPTSLESTITSARRSLPGRSLADVGDSLSDAEFVERADQLEDEEDVMPVADLGSLAASSSEHEGNTTYPPTLFGVIPLGNSFNISITYNASSKYAKTLPPSSLSDNPTTWTRQGVTYLNWTVAMAKGTRFLLVAGMSKDEQWASGGSSMLYTVGQGDTSCYNSNAAPSVTASSGDSMSTSGGGGHKPSGENPAIRTALASVFSVLGTLVIVGIVWWCLRLRRTRKNQAAKGNALQISLPKDERSDTPYTADSGEYPLANLSQGQQTQTPGAVHTDFARGPASPTDYIPSGGSTQSPTSPTHGRGYNDWNRVPLRGQSADPLLDSNTNSPVSPVSPMNGTWYPAPGVTRSNSGHLPLALHNGTFDSQGTSSEGHLSELKRETLAAIGGSGSAGTSPTLSHVAGGGRDMAGPGQGQRAARGRDEELEYVVHRDAGRVVRPRTEERRVLELPPRYEELNWESEANARGSDETEAEEGQEVLMGDGGAAAPARAVGAGAGAGLWQGVALGQPVQSRPPSRPISPVAPADHTGKPANSRQ